MTEKEYIEFRAKEAYEDKKQEMTTMFSKIKEGYLHFTKDYNECIDVIESKKD